MKNSFLLAKIIFKEIVRDKFFYLIIFFSIFFVFSTLILNEMVIGEPAKVTKDLTLSSAELLTFIFLLIYGSSIISKEIESKSLYTIEAKPISKSEYIVSNFLSIVFSSTIIQIFTLGFGILFIKIFYSEFWIIKPLYHLYFLFWETILLSSFALLFSVVFSSNFSMVIFLFLYVAGQSINSALTSIKEGMGTGISGFLNIIKFIIPNLNFFDYKTELLYSLQIKDSFFFLTPIYSLSYTLLLLYLSVILYERKQI